MTYKTRRKIQETQEKPLSEILNERKGYYQQKISEAFTEMQKALDKAYGAGDLSYIEQFEGAVAHMATATVFLPRKKTGIDKLLESIQQRGIAETEDKGLAGKTKGGEREAAGEKADKRPRLTKYQYFKSRDAGMTNEEIKKKFRLSNSYVLCGYGKSYQHQKGQREKTRAKKETDNRPLLNAYKDYAELRDSGMTNEQIKESHRIKKLQQISGWGSYYSRAIKKKA